MTAPLLSLVPQGTRWPSGECVDLAMLRIDEDELARRCGVALVRGFEDGLGPWAGTGGRLPSGADVEFVIYKMRPRVVMVRGDKNGNHVNTLDEVLRLMGFSRAEVDVAPIARG